MDSKVKRNLIGSISELKAQIWLLNQGYEVFSNVRATGPADLIAWNPETNELIKIDVKTIRVYLKKDGTKSYNFSGCGVLGEESLSNKANGDVKILGYCEEEDLFFWAS